jgi:hypothetical protein
MPNRNECRLHRGRHARMQYQRARPLVSRRRSRRAGVGSAAPFSFRIRSKRTAISSSWTSSPFASRSKVLNRQSTAPRSHSPIRLNSVPTRSAKPSWVRPASRRSSSSAWPNAPCAADRGLTRRRGGMFPQPFRLRSPLLAVLAANNWPVCLSPRPSFVQVVDATPRVPIGCRPVELVRIASISVRKLNKRAMEGAGDADRGRL